jgi:hypothetical protein
MLDHGILGPHSIALELQHFVQFSKSADIVSYKAQSVPKERTQNRKQQVRGRRLCIRLRNTPESEMEQHGDEAQNFPSDSFIFAMAENKEVDDMFRVGCVGKLDRSASSGTWNKCQKCSRL